MTWPGLEQMTPVRADKIEIIRLSSAPKALNSLNSCSSCLIQKKLNDFKGCRLNSLNTLKRSLALFKRALFRGLRLRPRGFSRGKTRPTKITKSRRRPIISGRGSDLSSHVLLDKTAPAGAHG